MALIFAASNAYLDIYPESDVRRYETEMLQFLKTKHSHILKNISEQKQVSAEIKTQLVSALEEFKAIFQASK